MNEPSRAGTGDERACFAIPRASLPRVIAERLRDMIARDELAPGAPIRERVIAETLNVSRTPLREALKMLAGEGLVELFANRGAVVASPTLGEVRAMLEVQRELEGLAGRLFHAAATPADVAEIGALHREMMDACGRGDHLGRATLDQGIHRKIVEAGRNHALAAFHANLGARLSRFRHQSGPWAAHWRTAMEEHAAILAAIEGGDREGLTALLRAHIDSAIGVVEGIIRANGAAAPA